MHPGDVQRRPDHEHGQAVAPSGSATNLLDTYIDITIERGTTGGSPAFGDCTGFTPGATLYGPDDLNNLLATNDDFATGLDNWGPTAAGQTRDFRFTYTFSASAPDTVQGSTATATFTWEAQA